jgi:WD40 repeat protein/Ca2+-binding EF-hand superfamily protein
MKRFHTQIHGFAIVEAQFEMILAFKPEVSEHIDLETLFEILDNDHDGRMDGLEFLGGLALCCNATFEEKCRFCFELFDFNLNSLLSKKELVMMMMSSLCGMNLLAGGGEELEPDIDVFENLAEEALARGDINADGQISYEEFVAWARSNRELMAGLETLNRIALDAKLDVQSEDSAPETEDEGGYLSDTEDEIDNPRKPEAGDQSMAIVPWLGQIQEPTNFKARKDLHRGPKTNLELVWVYGVNCKNHPNFVKYLYHSSYLEDVYCIYSSASVAIIYDFVLKTQFFYLGHKSEITSMGIHPNQQIVATGDRDSFIHIWTLDDNKHPTPILIFQSMVKVGIQQLAFSPSGDRLAVVGRDVDHTICFHNSLTGEVIASGKGISDPNNVNDIAFSLNGSELIMVGKNQIRFYMNTNTNKRGLEWKLGKIGNTGKRQNFLSATYVKENEAVVGCASGEIYQFKDTVCNLIVQAHGIKDPVLCLFFNAAEATLTSGGTDSVVKTWDLTLKEIGKPLDLSEDIDGDGKAESGSLNSCVRSIQHVKGKMLIGTLGSDIYEATLSNSANAPYNLLRVGCGHSSGELWGLDAHPTRDEFATVGDDCTIRLWSLRTHEQINARKMPKAARSVVYSPSGAIICVGMIDGEVSLVEASSASLRAYSSWKHSEKMINDVKFSPDGNYLAVASTDCNLYLYKSSDQKAFVRHAVCRGHSGAVTHIDFAANSQFLQSNSTDGSIMYWNLSGNQITHSFSMKDVSWATYTCVFGWHVQGIWPKSSDFTDINACLALPEIGDIITGDDFNKVNVFAYPAISTNMVHQSYSGHASHVTNVKCSWNKRLVISTGSSDKAILLWRHEVEVEDSDDEGDDILNKVILPESSCAEENPTVAPRSIQQQAANMGWSVNDLKDHIAATEGMETLLPSHGDQSEETPQWRSKIVEPTDASSSQNSTDVDLELHWVHGHRCHDCRNNVLYSSDGSVVYNAANLAVLYHKPTGKQHYLFGPHTDEVISIAIHPAGQIFATGEAGPKSNIVVWNSIDMKVLAKLEEVHETGVPLLAFNSNGTILASIGLDSRNTLSIHDWSKNMFIVSAPTNSDKVLCCSFLANDQLNLHTTAGGPSKRATGRNTRASQRQGLTDGTSSVKLEGKDVVVVGGEKGFLKFFWWQGQNLSSQTAIWTSNAHVMHPKDKVSTILSVASSNSCICVTGLANGNLLVWKDCQLISNTRMVVDAETIGPMMTMGLQTMESMPELGTAATKSHHHEYTYEETPDAESHYPHKHNPILAMHAIRGNIESVHEYSEHLLNYHYASRYLTGDKDGNVCIWRLVEKDGLKLVLLKHFNLRQFSPKASTFMVRSLCERDGLILVGNNSSEIFEIRDDSIPFMKNYAGQDLHDHTNSHLPSIPETKQPLAIDTKLLPAVPNKGTTFPADVEPEEVKVNPLSSGHSAGEIWGMAIHIKEPYFFTTGDDHYLKCWHLEYNTLVSSALLPDKSRAIAIHPNGKKLSCSLNNGDIVVIELSVFLPTNDKKPYLGGKIIQDVTAQLAIHDLWEAWKASSSSEKKINSTSNEPVSEFNKAEAKKVSPRVEGTDPKNVNTLCKFIDQPPKQWCQIIKYSFEPCVKENATTGTSEACTLFVAGSHDFKVYVYNASKDYQFLYIFDGHTSFVTHLDFGISLDIGRTNVPSKQEELYVFDEKKQIIGNITTTITESYDEVSNKISSHKTTRTDYLYGPAKTSKTIEDPPAREPGLKDVVIQSTSGCGELYFWNALDGSKIDSPNDIKDVHWTSFSCPYGWPVQGIYNPEDSLITVDSIYSVARSHTFKSVPVLAIADVYGRLRLFNYPCISYGSPDKCYKAHSGKITCIGFSADDNYLISLGGSDRSVIVWKTDIEDEIRSRAAYNAVPSTATGSGVTKEMASTPSSAVLSGPATKMIRGELEVQPFEESFEHVLDSVSFELLEGGPEGGDEFQAIKPWKSVIREPSTYKEDPEVTNSKNGKLPKAILELQYAYGYRGYDCRSNLFFGSHVNEIVYTTAGLGVAFNTKDNKQIFNNEHNADIISIAVHSDGHMVATGDVSKFPNIILWDINTGTTIKKLKFHKIGVSHLSFHPIEKNLLISCGLDDDRILVIHNISNGTIVGKSKIGKGISVYVLKSSPYASTFLTAGKNHLKFWDLPSQTSPGGELSSKTGIYNLKNVKTRNVCSCAYLGNDPVTGMDDGSLLLWKDRTNTKVIPNAHHGPITAMTSILSKQAPSSSNSNTTKTTGSNASANANRTVDGRDSGPRIVTGSKDGFVQIWDIQLNCIWTLNLNDTMLTSILSNTNSSTIGSASANAQPPQPELTPFQQQQNALLTPCLSHVQALDIKDNLLLIGTKSSEIFEINLIGSSNTNTINSSVTNNSFNCHMKGHFQERSELWGLSVHPKTPYLVTAGDDMTVRLWDYKNHLCKNVVNMQSKIRAIAYSPDGNHVAVGTYDGKLIVLSDDLSMIYFTNLISTSWIHVITYSPNGQQVAVGSHDSTIYLLETKAYSCRYKCKGHHSYITALDYSQDNLYLQSTSGDYELLFWNTLNGQQLFNINMIRDIVWSTLTCPFGWSVQGIWPKLADGTDVNSVDRSPHIISSGNGSSQQQQQSQLLITGDDFHTIKLFQYPVVKENQVNKEYFGHSQHVMKVKFSFDGKYVFSVGGIDKTLLQFEVKYS